MSTTDDTDATSRGSESNDLLGPLPEPAYGLAKRDSDDPSSASLGPWYSLGDMHDYAARRVAAERERCRALAEDRYSDLMMAVEWMLADGGHMTQEHLARIRSAWERA